MRAGQIGTWILLAGLLASLPLHAQGKRKVIIDEDAAGPAGTDEQAILALIQSPKTDVLGITVVTGDQWRNEEMAHTLRMLELIGRSDIPVVPGAVFPIDNSKQFIAQWEKLYGAVSYQGAWNWAPVHGPWVVPPLVEGNPTTKPLHEYAPEFMIRMVHRYPHQVTIYAGGPLTDVALAVTTDPHFAALTKGLVLMGGSIDPRSHNPDVRDHPQREFNFWMDPEATYAVLHADWPSIVDTPVDISIETRMTKAMIARIAKAKTPVARYIGRYGRPGYMWDELAAIAWLDPAVITRTRKLYLSVSLDRGATYGDTLAWPEGQKPAVGARLVTVNAGLDKARFYQDFIRLMTSPAPGAHFPNASGPATSSRKEQLQRR
jgi:inosine-uridine nucleoside N-ribohydrolase